VSDATPTRDELERRHAAAGEGYWSLVWAQFRKNREGMTGLVIVALIVLTALLAPLIANDRPIAASYRGNLSFPAFTTYVDDWVPWGSLRNSIKSWSWGEGVFPFSEHYPELEGRSWKAARAEDAEGFAWSVWPPVPWNPNQIHPEVLKKAPSDAPGHVLGTDNQGRDVLARLLHGAVVATTVGVIAMSIATLIGLAMGVSAGYAGGWTDLVLSRVTEIVMCFPTFFLIIAVISFLERSIINIMVVIGFVGWTGIFRLVRGEVLRVKTLDYVVAARALGVPTRRIMWRHVLPNAVAPVFVSVAFGIAGAVLTESSLSFLGFGDTTVPSWGEVVSQGRLYIVEGLTHLTIWPGAAVFVTLTGFNLFGQGLRDAMDPRLRH
jgi:peptide/nickel transport system permease protein